MSIPISIKINVVLNLSTVYLGLYCSGNKLGWKNWHNETHIKCKITYYLYYTTLELATS